MATSSNFFDDKTLAEFLTADETEDKTNQKGKPQPTERKQYSYSNDDDKSTNFQPTGKLIGPSSDPPDPGAETRAEMEKTLLKLEQTRDSLKEKVNTARSKLFEEFTNTDSNKEEVTKYTELAKEVDREWNRVIIQLCSFYTVLGKYDLATNAKEEGRLIKEQIATILELDGEGTQEKLIEQSSLTSPAYSLDSMLTGKDLQDDAASLIIGGAKKKIFPTFKLKNQKPSTILKQTSNDVTTLKKLQEMEWTCKRKESLLIQQIKGARFDLNNCESIDETSHFDDILSDIHDNLYTCQDLYTQMAKLQEEMNNEEKARKHKDSSKTLRNSVRMLEKDVYTTLGSFQNEKSQDHDSVFSDIRNGKFDELHGQSKTFNNVQSTMYNQYPNQQQDADFLGKIFDETEAQQRHEIEERAMKAKMELNNPQNRRNETNYPSYYDRGPFPTGENHAPSHFHGGGMGQGHSNHQNTVNELLQEAHKQVGSMDRLIEAERQAGKRQPNHQEDQRRPNQGFPNQGFPNQGYPNQGYGYGQMHDRTPDLKLKIPSLPKNAEIIRFYQWEHSFTTVMQRKGVDPNSLLFFLQEAIENEDLKKSIMSFHHSAAGYQRALKTLKRRFGDEQAFKLAIYTEIEEYRDKIDVRTGKGLWDLSTLLESIICNPNFEQEKVRNSLLYTKVATLLPKYKLDMYNLKYPIKEKQSLDTLTDWIGELAGENQEHDSYTRAHSSKPKDKSNKNGKGNPNAQKKYAYSSNTNPAPSGESKTKHDKGKKSYSKKPPKCNLCNLQHYTDKCTKLKGTLAEKEKVIVDGKLCTNCLGRHPFEKCYSPRRCFYCSEKHSSVLHDLKPSNDKAAESSEKKQEKNHKVENNHLDRKLPPGKQVLPVSYTSHVIPVSFFNIQTHQEEETLAYLDQGAGESWIHPDLAQKLQLPKIAKGGNVDVSTITSTKTYENTDIVEFGVSPIGEKAKMTQMIMRVMPDLPVCTYLDVDAIKKKHAYLKDVPLKTTQAKEIGIQIGRDQPDQLELISKVLGTKNGPRAYQYLLGWALTVPETQQQKVTNYHAKVVTRSEDIELPKVTLGPKKESDKAELSLDEKTNNAMKEILYQDNLFIEEKPAFSKEEEIAFEKVKESFDFEDGRPITGLPFNDKETLLKNNMSMALKRLESTNAKLKKLEMEEEF